MERLRDCCSDVAKQYRGMCLYSLSERLRSILIGARDLKQRCSERVAFPGSSVGFKGSTVGSELFPAIITQHPNMDTGESHSVAAHLDSLRHRTGSPGST